MCLALDPEGAEDWLGQEDEDDLAGELYAEEDLYPVIAEAPEVGIPELAPDLSGEQLVQLQDLLKEHSLVIQAKPGRITVIEHEIHVENAARLSEGVPNTIFLTGGCEEGAGRNVGGRGGSPFY